MSCLHPELTDGRCVVCGVEVAGWLIDAAALLAEGDPGPTNMLVEDLITDQALTAAVGKWKTTKSYGMLDICISVATGLPAFGRFAIPEPGPVVFVNEESGRRALCADSTPSVAVGRSSRSCSVVVFFSHRTPE